MRTGTTTGKYLRRSLLIAASAVTTQLAGCASDPGMSDDGGWQAVGEVSSGAPKGDVTAKALSIDIPSHRTAKSATREALALDSTRSMKDGNLVIRDVVSKGSAPAPSDKPADGDETTLKLESSGDLKLLRAVDFAEKAASEFDPPLTALPAKFTQGKPVVSECKIKITPIDDPKTVKHSGTAKQEVTFMGTQKVKTPAGEFDAVVIKTVFTADLGMPKVNNETTTWYVPGKGIAAERETQNVKALGVNMRNQTRHWVTDKFDGGNAGETKSAATSSEKQK